MLIFFCTTSYSEIVQINNTLKKKIEAIEKSKSVRIGLSALDIKNNQQQDYHARQRFAMCSTHKLMVVAAILKESMQDKNLLKQKIYYQKRDLAGYSPVTKQYIQEGMTIFDLCKAALQFSDNTATNLLIKQLGGIQVVNSFARAIGDYSFRLDRLEPALNTAVPGDLRDTTTPLAMQKSLYALVFGNYLDSWQRHQLVTWLIGNTTGKKRIRAGVPHSWIVADKTGTGAYGTTNDIAVIWPRHCQPLIIVIYLTQYNQMALPNEKIIAKLTRMLIDNFASDNNCIKELLFQ